MERYGCTYPKKVSEMYGLEIFMKQCGRDDVYYELRKPNGEIVQVYHDLQSAEKAAAYEAAEIEKRKVPVSDPALERLDAAFKAVEEAHQREIQAVRERFTSQGLPIPDILLTEEELKLKDEEIKTLRDEKSTEY